MSTKKSDLAISASHFPPDSLEAQVLRKLTQAEEIINVIEELVRKEYRGQPEVALVQKMIEDYRREWS